MKIHFAHSTFKWGNEAKNAASVHVVIIGFGNFDVDSKRLYEYENIIGEPHVKKVKNISPYLVEGRDIYVTPRSTPLSDAPQIIKGSETTDDGHFMLSEEDVMRLKKEYPESKKLIRAFVGGGDFINGRTRYCLWLKNAGNEIRTIPLIYERVEKVKQFRLSSNKARTRSWANYPTLFSEDRQPTKPYLIVPKVSSERRPYIPFAYMTPDVIINNTVSFIPEATLYVFGIIQSKMHMAWMRYVGGRTKSDYMYSNKIVYNPFPWPENPTSKQKSAIERAAQKVLDVRAEFPNSSLADLYDPLTMPPKLVKAHQELDNAVDLAYRPQPFTSETKRMEFLFELYEKYTADLFSGGDEKRRKSKKR